MRDKQELRSRWRGYLVDVLNVRDAMEGKLSCRGNGGREREK